MPLQGTFDVLDFTEVLSLLARQQLTGRLHVRSRSFGANLFLEEGLLVGADQSEHQTAATAGDVRSRIEEVCFEMLEAERGSFEFNPGKPSAIPVSERYEADVALDRARKRLEEWHELQALIPSLDLQPRLVLDLEQTQVTLDKERWRMLTSIDGRRNLRAIGRLLNLSDFDVCRVMRTLIVDDIVALEGIAALPASTRDAMPVVPAPEPSSPDVVVVPAEPAEPAPPGVAIGGTEGPVTGETPAVRVQPTTATDAAAATAPAGAASAPASGSADDPTESVDVADETEAGRKGRRVIRIRSRQDERA